MAILKGLAYQPIAFQVPDSEPDTLGAAKAVNSGILDWTATGIYILDPTQSNRMLGMQNIQSVFVDNYNTTGTTILTIPSTGHIIRIPPKAQAYLPLIASDRPVVQITNSSSNGTSQVWLLNIPALGVVWTLP
jgi:hypothetical protein